jgi:type II secretory pathway pseudopilin PulG
MTARDRMVLVVVCILAAIGAAWFFVVQPKRSEAAKLGTQITTAQGQLDAARAQVAEGQAAQSTFASNYLTLARLGEAVPSDDNVPSLIYQVQSAAAATGVDFRNLTVNPAGASAPAATSPTATQSATAALPPGAAVGPAGFPVEPFTFTFRGNFFHLSDFLGRLERFVVARNARISVSGRLMSLNAISLGAGPRGFPQITATVSATTYIVPATQGLLNGATAAGPAAPSASQPVSTPPSSSSSVPAAPATIATPVK